MRPDILDAASEYEQEQREIALANAKAESSKTILKRIQQCYNCEEPLSDEELFCDEDCREDYEFRKNRSQANIRII